MNRFLEIVAAIEVAALRLTLLVLLLWALYQFIRFALR